MRRAARALALTSLIAATLAVTQIAWARTLPGAPNSPACLRGHWVATKAESQRVLRVLVPGPYTFTGKLYMDFRDGTMQYGTTRFVISVPGAPPGSGSFFMAYTYTATRGRVTLSRGTGTVTVKGIATNVTSPGSVTPFQCNATRLRWKGPPQVGWLTLGRASS